MRNSKLLWKSNFIALIIYIFLTFLSGCMDKKESVLQRTKTSLIFDFQTINKINFLFKLNNHEVFKVSGLFEELKDKLSPSLEYEVLLNHDMSSKKLIVEVSLLSLGEKKQYNMLEFEATGFINMEISNNEYFTSIHYRQTSDQYFLFGINDKGVKVLLNDSPFLRD